MCVEQNKRLLLTDKDESKCVHIHLYFILNEYINIRLEIRILNPISNQFVGLICLFWFVGCLVGWFSWTDSK